MKSGIFLVALASLAISFLTSSCILEKRQTADGAVDTTFVRKSLPINDFSELRASGAIVVHYTQSPTPSDSIVIEGGASCVERVVVRQNEGVLCLSQKNGDGGGLFSLFSHADDIDVNVYVSSSSLQKIWLSGANSLYINGFYSTDKFSAAMSGASKLHLDSAVVANEADFGISGAGEVEFGCLETKSLEVGTSGAAEFNGKVRNAESIDVDMSGAGDVCLNLVDCGKVDCDLSGAANVKFSGNCETFSQSTSGASDVNVVGLCVVGKCGGGNPSLKYLLFFL